MAVKLTKKEALAYGFIKEEPKKSKPKSKAKAIKKPNKVKRIIKRTRYIWKSPKLGLKKSKSKHKGKSFFGVFGI